jgi:hypothetical protein
LPAGGAELASHEQNRDAEDPGASVSPIRWRWIGRKASNGMRSGNGVPMNRVSYEISLGKKRVLSGRPSRRLRLGGKRGRR